MESENLSRPAETTTSKFLLPAHSNKMVLSVICTLFCCLIGGIIAIINSSKSNSLYNSAMFASDDALKQSLYYESEAKNKTAQTWITVSLVCGAVYMVGVVIFTIIGVLADL